jgi:uncharacterized protein involved in outer membrane biogenesis
MKKFLYGLIGLVVVVAAILLVGPGLWDWNGFKPEILARIKAETGRDMAIDGDLSLAVLPSPRLAVDGVRVANVKGATAPEFARFKSLRVRVRLMPLLSGRIEVESVELIEPVIELERLADGRVNWEIGAPADAGGTGAPDSASGRSPSDGADGGSIALDRLLIRGGRLVYRDAGAGTVEQVTDLNVTASAGSLAGPFQLQGSMSLRGVALDVSASVGRLGGDEATPFDVRIGHAGAAAKAAISGRLESATSTARGKIEISGPSLVALARAATAGKSALPDWLGRKFALRAKLRASPDGASLDEIDLRFGDASASGGINAVIGERTRLDVALKVKRIDLDKWLALAGDTRRTRASGSEGSGAGRSPASGSAGAPPSGDGLVLPDGIDASLDVAVDAIAYKGRRMSDIRLAATLEKGAITLSRLSARLPGGGTASAKATLTAPGGKAEYEGETRVRADNLRAILDWLDVDVADVPADRLRKFHLQAKFAGDEDQIRIEDLEMRLDASRINGAITYALRDRPAFGARFNIDQINVDAYLPRARPGAATAAGKTGQPAGTPPPLDQSEPASPLAALRSFDANLVVNVGTLNYRRTPIQGVVFDGGLMDGTLTIRRARVRNVSGTTARIEGTLAGLAGVPVFKGTFSAASKDVTGLFRIAGIDTPVPPRRYGRLRLTGKADGGADGVKLDTKLEFAGAKISLTGALADLATAPTFDLDLRASHPDSARLAGLFGVEIGAKGSRLGGFDLRAEAKGRLEAVDLALRLATLGAEVTFAGTVAQAVAAPALTGVIEARHPDFAGLMRTLDPGYRTAKPATGPLQLSSTLRASAAAAKIEDLSGIIGTTTFAGTADIALAGAKPVVTAELTASDIDLDTLLPAGAGGPVPASPAAVAAPAAPTKGKPGARRYSRERIDLSALGSYDGDVRLSANSITWRTFRVDNPRLAATLRDSVLTLSRLTGKMFEGAFGLDGVLDAKKTPRVDGTIKIAKANVGKALFQGRKYDITNGVLDFDMKLAATGRSQHDMISSLSGAGRFAVRNGAVTGFDLKQISDRLDNLDRSLDFLSLFGRALSGGTTRFSSLDGRIKIDKGVVRTEDLNLSADASHGEAKGFVDLPRWNMDMQSRFRLTGHPGAPPFHVRLTGPPDQPDTKIDYHALQQFLVATVVQQGLGSLLRKAIPELATPDPAQSPDRAAPSEQPQQPAVPQKIRPKDLIRDLLRSLGR